MGILRAQHNGNVLHRNGDERNDWGVVSFGYTNKWGFESYLCWGVEIAFLRAKVHLQFLQ